MRITPEFIPHTYFHKGIWLLSEQDPAWYYFMEKQNDNTITNPGFVSSVDPALKEMVQFLHKRGISTTPSCSGHELGTETFIKIYDSIERDRYAIKTNGLLLTDIESSNKYLFRDSMYELPWTKRGFVDQGINYQLNGIIGLRLAHRPDIIRKIYKIIMPGVQMVVKDSILFISMLPHLRYSFDERWKMLTREIKHILRFNW